MALKPDPIRDAATAHTDLNTFGSVVSILEGGHIYGPRSARAAERIIRLCKAEQQRCLEDYDAAVERAKSVLPPLAPWGAVR